MTTAENKLKFDLFHASIQRLGDAYLRACLAVPVPPECEGYEMAAMLAMTIGACKLVGMPDAQIIDVTKKFVRGGVKLQEGTLS